MEISIEDAEHFPGSVAYLAQQDSVLVQPETRGIKSQRMERIASAIRRASKRTGDSVIVEFTGSASLRVRKAVR